MSDAKLIYQAIPKMLADVDAIGKDKRNQQQGFQYRGIDDVYNAVNPILAKHGVFVLTTVLDEKRQERETKSGGVLFYTRLTCRFDFCATDGSSVSSVIVGEAMDSGDKATNKALSVAFKYALFQLLCIPTEAVDPDKETHQDIKPRSQAAPKANGNGNYQKQPPKKATDQPPGDPFEAAKSAVLNCEQERFGTLLDQIIDGKRITADQKLEALELLAQRIVNSLDTGNEQVVVDALLAKIKVAKGELEHTFAQ